MLDAIRAEGSRPPFFVVHGLHGALAIAQAMGRALDRDQPLYALHARGIDGTEPPARSMEEMLRGYLTKIRGVRPHGPYVIGGVCSGGLVAMELAQTLAQQGEIVWPVILLDPPVVPCSIGHPDPTGDPAIYRQLYLGVEQVFRSFAHQFSYLPFNVDDPVQLHRAIDVGIETLVTLCRYVPPRFERATVLIASVERAFGYLHPQSPWQKVVPNPGRMHLIGGSHIDLLYQHLDEVLRILRFVLDSPFES
jgi:thioesterase domain-containing protein